MSHEITMCLCVPTLFWFQSDVIRCQDDKRCTWHSYISLPMWQGMVKAFPGKFTLTWWYSLVWWGSILNRESGVGRTLMSARVPFLCFHLMWTSSFAFLLSKLWAISFSMFSRPWWTTLRNKPQWTIHPKSLLIRPKVSVMSELPTTHTLKPQEFSTNFNKS